MSCEKIKKFGLQDVSCLLHFRNYGFFIFFFLINREIIKMPRSHASPDDKNGKNIAYNLMQPSPLRRYDAESAGRFIQQGEKADQVDPAAGNL
jgi:hypothetical protein